MELESLRREYLRGGLERADLLDDPIRQFQQWLEQAIELQVTDPTAMVLATVSPEGQPSQRIVLLKHLDDDGFVFYTNYGSRKAIELAGNPLVSLLFPWYGIERQVRVCGRAERIDAEQSRGYFTSRPRESQLAAWASRQSSAIDSRAALMEQLQRRKEQFADGDIPLPDFWGGLLVRPQQLEFWQGGAHRLHDRFEYNRQADGSWSIQRLAP